MFLLMVLMMLHEVGCLFLKVASFLSCQSSQEISMTIDLIHLLSSFVVPLMIDFTTAVVLWA